MKNILIAAFALLGLTATAQQELISAIENDNVSAFKSLIQSHDVNGCIEDTDSDYTPLMLAVSYGSKQVVSELLNNKNVDVESSCKTDVSALMIAANYKRTDMVKLLLEAGADAKRKDKYGRNAYEIAEMREDKATMKLFK
jgi:ankyrin repeat protein